MDAGFRIPDVVSPAVALLLQAFGVNLTDPAAAGGDNFSIVRQVDGSLSDAAVNVHVVVMFGRAAQVHIQLTDTHFYFHATQIEAAQVHVRFAGAYMRVEVQWNVVGDFD